MGVPNRFTRSHNPCADEAAAARNKRIWSAWNDTDLNISEVTKNFGGNSESVRRIIEDGIDRGFVTRPLRPVVRKRLSEVVSGLRGTVRTARRA